MRKPYITQPTVARPATHRRTDPFGQCRPGYMRRQATAGWIGGNGILES